MGKTCQKGFDSRFWVVKRFRTKADTEYVMHCKPRKTNSPRVLGNEEKKRREAVILRGEKYVPPNFAYILDIPEHLDDSKLEEIASKLGGIFDRTYHHNRILVTREIGNEILREYPRTRLYREL